MTVTLYGLEVGQKFRYKDEIYQLQDYGENGTAQAPRVARQKSDGTWMTAGPLLDSNFNAYCEVEAGNLNLIWQPYK